MSPSNMYFISLLLLLLSQTFDISGSQSNPDLCDPHDKSVLLRIKNELGNPSSFSSWDPNSDCCVWVNIFCDEQGHVTTFSISGARDVHGPIPPFLDQLPSLIGLFFLNVPNLSGPIPLYLGKLTNLTSLLISGTQISGPIPNLIAQFTNLTELALSSNKLIGPIPNFIGLLTKLTYLDLSNNSLTGPIPATFAQLTDINIIRLDTNKLSGPLPDYLSKLMNLNSVYLDFNSLSGPIPNSMGLIPNLTTLTLSNNQLTGPIPKSLGQTKLLFLNLSHNKLSGNASFLFDKANVADIDMHIEDNRLKFDFTNVELSLNLVAFNMSHNMIYGSLPKSFGLGHLHAIDVSFNQLCGPIPFGRRFKREDPAIFSHNKCLCGGPLRACK